MLKGVQPGALASGLLSTAPIDASTVAGRAGPRERRGVHRHGQGAQLHRPGCRFSSVWVCLSRSTASSGRARPAQPASQAAGGCGGVGAALPRPPPLPPGTAVGGCSWHVIRVCSAADELHPGACPCRRRSTAARWRSWTARRLSGCASPLWTTSPVGAGCDGKPSWAGAGCAGEPSW